MALVGGDEEWLQKHLGRSLVEDSFIGEDHKVDWIDAHSALRRRTSNRPRNNAGQFAERVRDATRKRRLAAIFWLTWNSSRVKALAIELGRIPWGMFRPGELVDDYRPEVSKICHLWKAFPKDSAAWAGTKLRRNFERTASPAQPPASSVPVLGCRLCSWRERERGQGERSGRKHLRE